MWWNKNEWIEKNNKRRIYRKIQRKIQITKHVMKTCALEKNATLKTCTLEIHANDQKHKNATWNMWKHARWKKHAWRKYITLLKITSTGLWEKTKMKRKHARCKTSHFQKKHLKQKKPPNATCNETRVLTNMQVHHKHGTLSTFQKSCQLRPLKTQLYQSDNDPHRPYDGKAAPRGTKLAPNKHSMETQGGLFLWHPFSSGGWRWRFTQRLWCPRRWRGLAGKP